MLKNSAGFRLRRTKPVDSTRCCNGRHRFPPGPKRSCAACNASSPRSVKAGGAEQFVESLLEGAWDPSKHPRLGGPPNAGWWASAGTGGQGAGNSSTSSPQRVSVSPRSADATRSAADGPAIVRRSAAAGAESAGGAAKQDNSGTRSTKATTAAYSASKNVPVHLAAAQKSTGHHWVPRAVFNEFGSRMERDAVRVFDIGTESTGLYDHAFDTWNGVTHAKYSEAVRALLDDWITQGGKKLGANEARRFLSWIATGTCDDASFAKKHRDGLSPRRAAADLRAD